MVRECGGVNGLYWDRKQVEKYARTRLPVRDSVPDKLVDSRAAAEILEVGRSSLYRYSMRKWLRPVHLRVQTPTGPRHQVYYRRDEVVKLKMHLSALHRRIEEMQRMLTDISHEEGDEEIA